MQNGAKIWVLPRSSSLTETGHENELESDLTVADQVTDGSVNYGGRPALRSKSGNWTACFLIFGTLLKSLALSRRSELQGQRPLNTRIF